MSNRITPDIVTNLQSYEVFVFGSNLSGRHGAGAARTAMKWGAKYGQAAGLQGKTYAIPTVDETVTRTLTIAEIKPYVNGFIIFAKNNESLTFLVTEIGCGIAGYDEYDIAPLFEDAVHVKNISLPKKFWKVLLKK